MPKLKHPRPLDLPGRPSPYGKNKKKKNSTSFTKETAPKRKGLGKKGRSQKSFEERAVVQLDKTMVSRYISSNFHLKKQDVLRKLKKYDALEPDAPNIFEAGVLRIMLHVAEYGDVAKMDFLFDRMVGKSTAEIKINREGEFDNLTMVQLQELRDNYAVQNEVHLRYIEKQPYMQEKIDKAQAEKDLVDVTPVETTSTTEETPQEESNNNGREEPT